MKTLTVLVLLCTLSAGARAQDGPALMRKMQSAYAALRSYRHIVNTTVNAKPGGSAGSTAEVRYQAPNRAYVSITSPQMGTLIAASNGREQVLYRSTINAYRKLPAPPNLLGFARNMAAVGVRFPLDPVYFLSGLKAETSAGNFVSKGMTTLNGAPCYLVKGKLKASGGALAAVGDATFWVDRSSSLLRKVRIEMKGIPIDAVRPVVRNGKRVNERVRLKVDQTITEVVQEMQANPPMKDADFNFAIPKGAVEQNPEKLLGK